ncbi:MAG: hypothetical protein H9893_04250 [Candidatus Niameybacter stercoravium]|nr:hypothetical protein [Candidatus Niameybacter stercoravium]
MTLLEVMLTLVLSSLFFCCALQFIGMGTKFYVKTREKQGLRLAMNQVMRTIEEQYEEAAHLCIYIGESENNLKSLSGCEYGKHSRKPIIEGDYTRYFLYYIDYYMPYEMYKTKENDEKESVTTRIILKENLDKKQENEEKLFKISFQRQTLINNDLKIKLDVKDEYLILNFTIFNERGTYLEDQLKLDLRYKL